MSYLRPYQGEIRDAVIAVLSNGSESTLYVQPTGTGKTEVALDIIDQWPDKQCGVLCLAHRQELIWQPWNRWQTKTGDYAEIEMGDQRRGRRSRVTFASKDSLHPGRLRQAFPDPRSVKLIWIDECIAGGESVLMADGSTKPIELIRPGDGVMCYDGYTILPSYVTRQWSSGVRLTIRISTVEGHSIQCTPNHPIFTLRGWVPAGLLTLEDRVFIAHADADRHSNLIAGRKTSDSSGVMTSARQTGVQPCPVSSDRLFSGHCSEIRASAFRIPDPQMPASLSITASPSASGPNTKPPFSRQLVSCYGMHQILATVTCWCEACRSACRALRNYIHTSFTKAARLLPTNALHSSAQSDWPGGFVTTVPAAGRLGLRSIRKDMIDNPLLSLDVTSSRTLVHAACQQAERAVASSTCSPTAESPSGNRLNRLSLTACDGSFVRLSSIHAGGQSPVYDIEVAGHHNFFCSGILVHNCHHVVNKTRSYGHILDYFRAANPDLRIFGCTATPDRTDEHALGQTFQSVAAEYPLLDPAGGPSAITDGWLVPIQQHVVVCEGISFEKVKTRGKKGDFVEGDLEKMLLENEILEAIVGATRSVADGKTTLCFTSGIHQAIKEAGIFDAEQPNMARAIASTIPPELYHDYVVRSDDQEARQQMLRAWARGDFQYVCNVGVFTEGMDEPRIAVISMGRPTKSRALYAQMAGRGTRVLPGLIEGRREDGSIWRLETREQRLQAIQNSAKPFLTVLDFVGVSRHSLVSAVDILGGKYEDEIVEEARARIASGERDVQQALAHAAADRVLQARKEFKAKVDFRLQTVDPFALFNVVQSREPGWHRGRMATPKQQEALIKFGMDRRTVAKLSFHKASELMDTFIKRIKQQQCSYRQAKVLAKAGVDPEPIGFQQASAMIDRIRRGAEVTLAEDVIARIRTCKTPEELSEVAQTAKQLRPIYQPSEWEDIVLAGKAKREHLVNPEPDMAEPGSAG